MAKAPKPRGTKSVKVGDSRYESLKKGAPSPGEAPKAPRSKPSFANAPRPGSAPAAPRGTNKVGLPARTNTPMVVRKNTLPAVVKKGSSLLGKVAKVAGPLGIAIGMIADAKPAGAGSDKPSGGLMKGNRVYGGARPETPGRYPKANPNLGIGEGSRSPSPKPASPAPKPTARPSAPAPKPTARPSMAKGSATPPAYTPEKAKKQVGGKVSSGFSGNWTGAAPTEMQKRGGAKLSNGGGLLGKLRKKG